MKQIEELMSLIREFAKNRGWEKFHTPKNLAMAVSGEAGELVAEFQWLTAQESERSQLSESKFNDIEMEIADVAIYLLRLVDVLEVDLPSAIRRKIAINEGRF
jgi:NTP pyrophosphatase (non-canonical NTP hydrolase)